MTIVTLLKALAAAFLFTTSAFAKSEPKKCARELQDLLYAPQTLKFDYLRRAAAAFPSDAPSFWTSNVSIVSGFPSDPTFNSLLLAFENTWGVTVLLTLSDGDQFYYTPDSLTDNPAGNDTEFSPTIFSHDLNQSNMKFGSFTSHLNVTAFTGNGSNFEYSYTFVVVNCDGAVRYVSLWLPGFVNIA